MTNVYLERDRSLRLLPETHATLTTMLLDRAKAQGPESCAGDTTLTVDGKAYTGTVLVSGSNPDITFRIRSVEAVKGAPAKAAAKKAGAKKGRK